MQKITDVWYWIDGKKTYIAAFFVAAQGIVIDGWVNHDWKTAVEKLQAALVVSGIRSGMNKI